MSTPFLISLIRSTPPCHYCTNDQDSHSYHEDEVESSGFIQTAFLPEHLLRRHTGAGNGTHSDAEHSTHAPSKLTNARCKCYKLPKPPTSFHKHPSEDLPTPRAQRRSLISDKNKHSRGTFKMEPTGRFWPRVHRDVITPWQCHQHKGNTCGIWPNLGPLQE